MTAEQINLMSHLLKRSYPRRITIIGLQYQGEFPDLPGCMIINANLNQLYSHLEMARYVWIYKQIMNQQVVPAPNSYLNKKLLQS